jgi:hypothetical protein
LVTPFECIKRIKISLKEEYLHKMIRVLHKEENTRLNINNPMFRRLLREPNTYINLLQSGELWHIDFANGIAKRVKRSDRMHDEYPFYYSDSANIEMYLLLSFTHSGLDIKIDSSKKKQKHIVTFSVPTIEKYHLDSNRLSEP